MTCNLRHPAGLHRPVPKPLKCALPAHIYISAYPTAVSTYLYIYISVYLYICISVCLYIWISYRVRFQPISTYLHIIQPYLHICATSPTISTYSSRIYISVYLYICISIYLYIHIYEYHTGCASSPYLHICISYSYIYISKPHLQRYLHILAISTHLSHICVRFSAVSPYLSPAIPTHSSDIYVSVHLPVIYISVYHTGCASSHIYTFA